MKLTITLKGVPKEIADLVHGIQNQPSNDETAVNEVIRQIAREEIGDMPSNTI